MSRVMGVCFKNQDCKKGYSVSVRQNKMTYEYDGLKSFHMSFFCNFSML